MPIDNEVIDSIPEWMLAADYNDVKSVIEFLYKNKDSAYTKDEIQSEVDIDINSIIDILYELNYADYIERKGAYFKPNNIEEAHSNWKEIKHKIKP